MMKHVLQISLMALAFMGISTPAFNQAIRLDDNHSLTGFPFNGKLLLGSDRDSTLWISDGTAGGTTQISTIKADNSGSAEFNGKLYFQGMNAANGGELWQTDGTAAGTIMTADILPGADSSKPEDFFVYNNKLYFTAYTPTHGRELYEYTGNGAPARITDLNNGSANSFSDPNIYINNNVLYFDAINNTGKAIYTIKGNTISKLLDMTAGTSLGMFAKIGNTTFFPIYGGFQGCKIYKTDGTIAGTTMLKDFTAMLAGFADPMLTNIDNKIYFGGTTDAEGREPWVTDGNTINMIKDINPGTESSGGFFLNAVVLKGKIVFMAQTENEGLELWTTDGTAAGTALLKDINPAGDANPILFPAFNMDLTQFNPNWLDVFNRHNNYNGYIFFTATDITNGQALWKTDGTAANTVMVKAGFQSVEDNDQVFGSYIYTRSGFIFGGDDGSGTQPWISDGTESGTRGLVTINSTGDSNPDFLFIWNGDIYFNADDGNSGGSFYDLYKLQGPYQPLPVTLENLVVHTRPSSVLITWATASESNSDRFDVMRSTDGRYFEKIGEVAAAGKSNTVRQYAYDDTHAYNQGVSKLYYRLDMQDKDGRSALSKIVSATINPLSASLSIFPNPVHDLLKVHYNTTQNSILIISDLNGRILYKADIEVSMNGVHQTNVSALPSGTYILKLTGEKGQVNSLRFIKK